jgi:hypothetical protein
MLNKILFVIALGCFAGLTSTYADSTLEGRVKGRIIAARVEGHVDAISKADGARRTLHDGDLLTEQTTVVTAPGANVILVFSNGATVNVAGDSNLDIEQFDQDPFSESIKVSDIKQELGTSTTRLNLTKGELVGKVVHLNVDRGSQFTVQTPVGAAGIRGTVFRIVFHPLPNGKAFFVVTTADGRVVFTGVTANQVSIPAGKQVVATFDYTPGQPASTASPVTVVTNTPPTETAAIQAASQAIVTATVNTVIPPSSSNGPNGNGTGNGNGNGGGNGNGNGSGNGNGNGSGAADTVPPPPAIPAPATDPQAGSP